MGLEARKRWSNFEPIFRRDRISQMLFDPKLGYTLLRSKFDKNDALRCTIASTVEIPFLAISKHSYASRATAAQ